jgi:hypothetical protein
MPFLKRETSFKGSTMSAFSGCCVVYFQSLVTEGDDITLTVKAKDLPATPPQLKATNNS